MEVSSRRRQCDLRQRRSPLVFLFFFATLSLSCKIAAAARLLDVAYTEQFAAADDTNSKPSGKLQEFELGAKDKYHEDIPRGGEFAMRYLKEEGTQDGRKLPPTPPIVHGIIPPCPAPPPPQAVKQDAKEKKSPLLCIPIL